MAVLAMALLAASCNRNSNTQVSGTIETDEVRIASRYGGRVERIFAQEGDALNPGEVVVQLDAAELEARRNNLAAMLAEAEAGPRKEEIEAAQHDWQSLKSDLELAQTDSKRAV